jgi:meiotically up-regulated gene 157 (Mug157) protein
MVKSAFRPSDDATKLPFNIPQNALACSVLRDTAALLDRLPSSALVRTLREEALEISIDIDEGIKAHGMMQHPTAGLVYAYEVPPHPPCFSSSLRLFPYSLFPPSSSFLLLPPPHHNL